MKILKFISPLFILFSIHSLSAQYGQGGYGGYGESRMGSQNQQIGNQSRQVAVKEKPIEETVNKIVDKLKKELTLDELQVIAINNIITESIKKQNAVFKKESENDNKTNEIKAITEKTDLDILILLNKDQKATYKLLSEDAKNKQDALNRKGR